MKLIHTMLVAGVASLLPSAVAQEPAGKSPRPFVITVSSDLSPVSHAEFSYPYAAGSRGLDGVCNVSFVVDADGRADGISVDACSSTAFQRAARKVVDSMTFPARATSERTSMQIRWAFERSDPRMKTVSLN